MYKLFIVLVCISYVISLSCTNEFDEAYNQIIIASGITTEVCHACTSHCLTCESIDCTECEDGYYKYKDESAQVIYCKENYTAEVDGCKYYNTEDKCIDCFEDYWKKSKTECIKKSQSFIDKCDAWKEDQATEACQKAKSGYGLNDLGTEFIDCSENCILCSESQCTECAEGYHLSDTLKECIQNEGICKEWKNVTESECNECPTGYTANGEYCYNSKCKCESGKEGTYPDCSITCPENCDICDSSTVCSKCKLGYYLSDNACVNECRENCDICTTDIDCSQCTVNYMLNNDGQCVEPLTSNCKQSNDDNSACSSCHEKYFLLENDENDEVTCEACNVNNCIQCSDADTCTECARGYILYDDGYNKPSCIVCNDLNAKYQGECTGDQWMKFPWQCSELQSNCVASEVLDVLIGVNEQFCSKCENGYGVDSEKKCVKCLVDNCANCDADENNCVTCETGFFREEVEDTVKCSACAEHCNQCESNTVCLDCEIGYVFSSDLSMCKPCNAITHCEKCWKEGECLECEKGYYVSEDNTTCMKCPDGCQSCYDETHCQECNSFYFLEEMNCVECIDDCEVCDNKFTCIQCKENYLLSTDKKYCMFEDECKTENVNCKTCNTEDTTKCVGCNNGYYLETTLCKSCLENCVTCDDNTECSVCEEGYELNSDKTQCNKATNKEAACYSVVDKCIKCNPDQLAKCILCESGSVPKEDGTCECQDGYYLIDGSCKLQQIDDINFDDISEVEIEELLEYIDAASSGDKKANNTEKVLKQLYSQLETVDETTGAQAVTLLLALAETATTEDGQSYFKKVLKSLCETEGLSDQFYQQSISAADSYYLIINGSERESVYNYGFSNCVKNYLKKSSPGDISVMKLKNSEFQIKELVVAEMGNEDQLISFTDTSVVATIDLKAYLFSKSEENSYYMVAQSINHDGNPFKYEQNNSVMYESKLMSVSIMSKTSKTDTDAPTAVPVTMGGKTFTVTFDFEGTKCGHYDEDKLEWLLDGNATGKICSFNHTTHFVIYQETPVETQNANIMKVFSLIWILVGVLLF